MALPETETVSFQKIIGRLDGQGPIFKLPEYDSLPAKTSPPKIAPVGRPSGQSRTAARQFRQGSIPVSGDVARIAMEEGHSRGSGFTGL
jgi:hypothetical protein